MIAQVEEMIAPLNRAYLSLSIKNYAIRFLLTTKIKRPFLASNYSGRDLAWFSVPRWEKTQDLGLALLMLS